jgi:hypothetical protein
MSSYQVAAARENGLWVADIRGPGLGPAATDTVHFADLEAEVRDLVAGLTGTHPDGLDLTWRYCPRLPRPGLVAGRGRGR